MIAICSAQAGRAFVVACLMGALGSSGALAQPSSEWKRALPDFDVFIHTDSIALEKAPDGKKVLRVWTVKNFASPMDVGAGRAASMKTFWTIYCESRISEERRRVYEKPNAQGNEIDLGWLLSGPENIQPETLGMALRDKYCSSWAFLR